MSAHRKNKPLGPKTATEFSADALVARLAAVTYLAHLDPDGREQVVREAEQHRAVLEEVRSRPMGESHVDEVVDYVVAARG